MHPALVFNDAGAGVGDAQVEVTAFPDGIAQAASWDVAAQRAYGATLGWEAWHKGINVQLAPGVNIARVAAERPQLRVRRRGPLPRRPDRGAAVIQGIQSQHVVATIKHYALNNQETNRMTVSSDADERTMQEIYLPAFEAAVKPGRRRRGDVLLQQGQRRLRLREPDAARPATSSASSASPAGSCPTGRATHSTVAAANAGLDQEQTDRPRDLLRRAH